MSQKNIDFMKKNIYQLRKQETPPADDVVVDLVQELLSGQLEGDETFSDENMPTISLSSDLNWYEGSAPDDEIVRIINSAFFKYDKYKLNDTTNCNFPAFVLEKVPVKRQQLMFSFME